MGNKSTYSQPYAGNLLANAGEDDLFFFVANVVQFNCCDRCGISCVVPRVGDTGDELMMATMVATSGDDNGGNAVALVRRMAR
eukprot:9305045-Pyramimonas_sp.AAC.1